MTKKKRLAVRLAGKRQRIAALSRWIAKGRNHG